MTKTTKDSQAVLTADDEKVIARLGLDRAKFIEARRAESGLPAVATAPKVEAAHEGRALSDDDEAAARLVARSMSISIEEARKHVAAQKASEAAARARAAR